MTTPAPAPQEPSLIEYPSQFPIKVMGLNQAGFANDIVAIAQRFDPSYDRATLEERPSKSATYLGLTITITATSRQQLDDLYRALTAHAWVKTVL